MAQPTPVVAWKGLAEALFPSPLRSNGPAGECRTQPIVAPPPSAVPGDVGDAEAVRSAGRCAAEPMLRGDLGESIQGDVGAARAAGAAERSSAAVDAPHGPSAAAAGARAAAAAGGARAGSQTTVCNGCGSAGNADAAAVSSWCFLSRSATSASLQGTVRYSTVRYGTVRSGPSQCV